MANILLNYQSRSLRYALEELKEHNLYSWRSLGHDFSKKNSIKLNSNIIENIDIYNTDRKILANKIKKFYKEKNIDKIFPIYVDTIFPYIYKELGFTKKQADILSNKEKYTKFAKQNNIPVPVTFKNIRKAKFPVIAKPVNGTGSVGIKVLHYYEDYEYFTSGEDEQFNCLEKYYIFQNFIEGTTVSAGGRIVDGKVFLDCLYTIESSKLPYRAETGFVFKPNQYNEELVKKYITIMLTKLNIKNSAWMADFIFDGNDFYLVDFSPRLSVSVQSIIKYSANVDYNKIVLDSLLHQDKTEINLNKSVVYRYFDLPKGNYKIDFIGDKLLADEFLLPNKTTYLERIDALMCFKGYCITSGSSLEEAEMKWQTIANNIKYIKLE